MLGDWGRGGICNVRRPNKAKEFIFMIGLSKKCPVCGYKLTEHGYGDPPFSNYRCDECGWGV